MVEIQSGRGTKTLDESRMSSQSHSVAFEFLESSRHLIAVCKLLYLNSSIRRSNCPKKNYAQLACIYNNVHIFHICSALDISPNCQVLYLGYDPISPVSRAIWRYHLMKKYQPRSTVSTYFVVVYRKHIEVLHV